MMLTASWHMLTMTKTHTKTNTKTEKRKLPRRKGSCIKHSYSVLQYILGYIRVLHSLLCLVAFMLRLFLNGNQSSQWVVVSKYLWGLQLCSDGKLFIEWKISPTFFTFDESRWVEVSWKKLPYHKILKSTFYGFFPAGARSALAGPKGWKVPKGPF